MRRSRGLGDVYKRQLDGGFGGARIVPVPLEKPKSINQ
jgi:hypothetical protein